ncbi:MULTISPECIES: PPE family protein [unclassified Saccharothrix]|uniref:PPE family protein n=1 Tax=unclassified Saccharothrix TaxID=2593673 RepID=UPI00307F104D
MTGIGNHNFDAQSHRQLYDKIHGGPGHSAAQAVDDAWNAFRAIMGNAKSELESAIRDSRAVWVGAAGEQFAAGSAPLVQWAEDARVAGVETHQAFAAQTSFYGSAKDRMPEPVEVTSTANDDFWGIPAGFQHLVGGQTDQDLQEQAALEAKREAVRVMNGYRDGAAAAVDLLGAFTPPPQVVTEVAEPTFDPSTPQEPRSRQYDEPSSTTTSDKHQDTPPEIAPPAVVPQPDGETNTSAVQPPADVAPKPAPVQPPPPNTSVPPVLKETHVPPPAGFQRRPASAPPPRSTPPTRSTGNGTGKAPGGIPSAGSPRPAPIAPSPIAPGQPATGQPPAGSDNTRSPRGVVSAPPAGGVVGGPQRGPGEDDVEHKSAPYLEELADLWGEDDIPRVSPPVIGDDD